ncbi:(2Fe-2S)-binding protein, partial [Myxococcota bacterium]|nr:(2Fe-2S)-binding protein [Myxococcota bacterium]
EVWEDTDPVVCLCERIRKSEIVGEIRRGVRDMNQLKATLRTGMGACGGKTCTSQIQRIFREEGVELSAVTTPTDRPFVAEVHLGDFLNVEHNGEE